MNGLDAFKVFRESVRERSDLVEIIGRDVALRRVGSALKGLSPFHAEKHASLVVWPATQTWHDYSNGGGLGGDVFTYVQEREKISFKEAVLLLAERAGVRRPNQDDASWQRGMAIAAERRDVERLLTAAAAYYHDHLPDKIRDQCFRQHYGFTAETIDKLMLGWADGHLFEALTTEDSASKTLALKTGLFVVLASGRVVDLFRNRLVFPYWRGGRVSYFTARATEYTEAKPWEEAKYKKQLTHSERHNYVSPTVRNDYFYNEDAARGAEELVITEGTPDCISAMQAGVACISTSTTSFRDQDLPRLLELTRTATRIIVCNDSEKSGAGETAAIGLAAKLWSAGREAAIATIPRPEGLDKIDLNELVVTQGPEALAPVLADAKGYPEFLLDRIPTNASSADLDRLLTPVLASLSSRSAIRGDGVMKAISAKFDVGRRALTERRKTLAEASQRATAASPPQAGPTPPGAAQTPPAARLPRASRPEIQVNGRSPDEIVNDACAMLGQANEALIRRAAVSGFANYAAPLFRRDDTLVRLRRPRKGAPMLVNVSEAGLSGILMRGATWLVVTEERATPVGPPKDVMRDLLVHPPSILPDVETIVTTPTFGSDGQLLCSPGLHPSECLWLDPDPSLQLADVPSQPTPADIAAARSMFFDELLVDFPFVGPSDRANAVAALLLPFMRRLIDGYTPLHIVEAPAVGAGKGLLCNLVGLLVTGTACSARTLPDSDDEVRKMLTAELSTGRSIILLDNANDKQTLGAPALASVLTTESWTDRLLGHTEMITVANHAMWMLTGTNPKMSRDIARRSVRIRIDPKTDRAWLRSEFKHDPLLDWVKRHRGELVHAALVLVQAWLAAGRPLSRARLGSFEQWAKVIGGVLEVAGIEGFLGNATELYEYADIEGQAWREFTQAWWDAHGQTPLHASTLAELCEKQELMSQVRGDGNARSQQTRLGRAVHSARDRIFDGLQVVVESPDRKKRTLYALRRVDPGASAGAAESGTNGGFADVPSADPAMPDVSADDDSDEDDDA